TEAEAFRKRSMAEADRDQARLVAEAEAYRNTTLAEAEAQAVRIRAEAAAHAERTTAEGLADANNAKAGSAWLPSLTSCATRSRSLMIPSTVSAPTMDRKWPAKMRPTSSSIRSCSARNRRAAFAIDTSSSPTLNAARALAMGDDAMSLIRRGPAE